MEETGMRIAMVATSLALVGGMATACGGGGGGSASGSPDDASKDAFCKASEAVSIGTDKLSQDELDKRVKALKDTGTPKGISSDERHGFEVLVKALDNTDVDKLDRGTQFEDVVKDAGDRADATKFFLYYGKTCADVGNVPTDIPTDIPTLPSDFPTSFPTELPSGVPTDFPTDFPSDLPTDFPTS
jgi:hypothetical protein